MLESIFSWAYTFFFEMSVQIKYLVEDICKPYLTKSVCLVYKELSKLNSQKTKQSKMNSQVTEDLQMTNIFEWLKWKIMTPPNSGKGAEIPDHSSITGGGIECCSHSGEHISAVY